MDTTNALSHWHTAQHFKDRHQCLVEKGVKIIHVSPKPVNCLLLYRVFYVFGISHGFATATYSYQSTRHTFRPYTRANDYYYVTYLTTKFTSTKSISNYVSGCSLATQTARPHPRSPGFISHHVPIVGVRFDDEDPPCPSLLLASSEHDCASYPQVSASCGQPC